MGVCGGKMSAGPVVISHRPPAIAHLFNRRAARLPRYT